MSLSDLRADIARNQKAASQLVAQGVPQAIVDYINGTQWAWAEALMDEIDQIDESIDTLIEESDDILQAETAGTLSVALALGHDLASELARRVALEPDSPEKTQLQAKIKAFGKSFLESCDIIKECTVADDFEDDPDAETGEDDDEDEGDDGEEE